MQNTTLPNTAAAIDTNITKKRLPFVSATKAPIVGITIVAGTPGQFRCSKKITTNNAVQDEKTTFYEIVQTIKLKKVII